MEVPREDGEDGEEEVEGEDTPDSRVRSRKSGAASKVRAHRPQRAGLSVPRPACETGKGVVRQIGQARLKDGGGAVVVARGSATASGERAGVARERGLLRGGRADGPEPADADCAWLGVRGVNP